MLHDRKRFLDQFDHDRISKQDMVRNPLRHLLFPAEYPGQFVP